MAVMTISEARAALPDVVNRVAEGEEVTITRHGRPAAVLVRPDIVWSQQPVDVVLGQAGALAAALLERARHHRVTLRQELDSLLAAAEEEPQREAPGIRLHTVRVAGGSTWPRTEIYGDEGR